MKWLKSTTDKTYTAQGKIIPSMNSAPLALDDSAYEAITSMSVIKSLIKTGGIIVLDRYNEPQANSSEQKKLQQLHLENTRLQSEIAELKAKQPDEETVKKAAQFDELKTEAESTIAARDAEIAELKAQLEAKSKKSSAKKED